MVDTGTRVHSEQPVPGSLPAAPTRTPNTTVPDPLDNCLLSFGLCNLMKMHNLPRQNEI